MRSRTQLQILGISLIAVLVQAAACGPATAPAPTPVPTKPAASLASTPVPTASAPSPAATPTLTPTVAPTVAPTRSAATPTAAPTRRAATPTVSRSTPTPTRAAAPTSSTVGQGASGVADCGIDLGCFIEASRTGRLAKVDYTMAVDFFGMFLANTDSLAIKGKEGDRLLFSQNTIAADAALTEAMIKAAQAKGMSDTDVQKALTTAKGVADLMQAASTNVDPSLVNQLNSARENQRARIGTGKECRFPQAPLTAMLERWQKGQFSSSDYDPGQCTDLPAAAAPAGTSRPSATPAAGVPTGGVPTGTAVRATPTAGTGATPIRIEDVPIPPGFDFVESGGWSSDNGRIFGDSATWTGEASMQEIAAFYARALAAEWESRGGVVGDAIVDVRYDQKNTDPVIVLKLYAEPSGEGVTLTLTLSNEEG